MADPQPNQQQQQQQAPAAPALNAQQVQAILNNLAANVAAGGGGGTVTKMPRFSSADPGEWRVWRSNFAAHAEANNWNEARQRAILQCSFDGDAHRHIQGVAFGNRAIQDILRDMDACFLTEQASAAARTEFRTAAQLATESITNWKARIRELFLRAYPARAADLEQAPDLIEAFVDGLRGFNLRSRVRQLGALNTLAGAVTRAQEQEHTLLRDARDQGGPGGHKGGGLHALQPPQGPTAEGGTEGTPSGPAGAVEQLANALMALGVRGQPAKGAALCWTCQSSSHLRRDCPKEAGRAGGANSTGRGKGNRGRGTSGRNRQGGGGRGRKGGRTSLNGMDLPPPEGDGTGDPEWLDQLVGAMGSGN